MPESLKTTTIRIHIISSIMPIPARRRIPFIVSASILLSFLEMYLEHEIHVPVVIAIKINIVIISIKIFMAAPVIKSFYVIL